MAPTILHAVILQATSRSMIFRKCDECTNKIIGIAQNVELRSAGVLYYCPECDKDVDKYKANYDLQLIVSVSNGQKIQQAAVYDEGVSRLLGCSADKLCELLLENPALLDEIEEKLIGLRCHLVTRQEKKKKGKKPSNNVVIVDAIIPADPRFRPVFVENEET
ncbi:hypothetical protein BDC45DRAFT_535118 [Circinella umbellata]|nr:hypothetical protein BDC45DRAFT_535118 [Circinella umbellata]